MNDVTGEAVVETTDTNTDVADKGDSGTVDTSTVLTGGDDATQESTDTSDGAGDGTGNSDQDGPDSYADFTLPDGMELNESVMSEALPLFKEMGLTQAQAQQLVDLEVKRVQAEGERQVDTYNQLMKDWVNQAKTDKEIGGDNWERNIKVAQNAISKFGTPELKQLLNEHGLGNHPEFIRFAVKAGAQLPEDKPGNGNPGQATADRVSILYPNAKR